MSQTSQRQKLPLLFDHLLATGEHQDAIVIRAARRAAILLRMRKIFGVLLRAQHVFEVRDT
jgi:hypothetical protein